MERGFGFGLTVLALALAWTSAVSAEPGTGRRIPTGEIDRRLAELERRFDPSKQPPAGDNEGHSASPPPGGGARNGSASGIGGGGNSPPRTNPVPAPPVTPPPAQTGGPIGGTPTGRPPLDLPLPPADPIPNDLPPGPREDLGELVVDLRKGTGKDELERLKALVFTINSINNTTTQLLTVEDVLKASFRDGKIPKDGDAKVKIDLTKFLDEQQRGQLREILIDDPFACNREKDLQSGVRVDSLVNNVFNPENYNKLLGLDGGRRATNRKYGVDDEFDGRPEDRDTSGDTQRLLIAPGESGIVHNNAFRKIVVQKQRGRARGRDGLLFITTEDTEKHNATKKDRNMAQRPVTAKGDAHEIIGELPNGMRFYGLQNRAGVTQTAAPPTLVTARIINPMSCMTCHDSGFIATTGESRSTAHGDLTKVELNNAEPGVRRGLAKELYKTTPKDYNDTIEVANTRMQKAVEKSGAFSPREFAKFYSAVQDSKMRLDAIAKDIGTDTETLASTVAGDRNIKGVVGADVIEAIKKYQQSKSDEDLPTIKRNDLERDITVGRDETQSLYCALKQRTVGIDTARLGRKREGDALVLDPKAAPRRPAGLPKDAHM